MKSYKISGRRLIAIGAVCLVVLGFVVYSAGARLAGGGSKQVETDAVSTGKRAAKGTAKTESDRAAFIAQFGWKADAEPVEIAEIVIPEEFDEVYNRYNELQKQQGYNLEKHRGERCKRYTYQVLNYPDTKQEVHINLMVRDGRIIGGDVSSTVLGGFMQGFEKGSAVLDTAQLETSLQEHTTPTDAAQLEEVLAEEIAEMVKSLHEPVAGEMTEEKAAPTAAQMPTD